MTPGDRQVDTSAFVGYYGTPRLNLLALIDGAEPRHALEIGCGMGANLGALKRRFTACRTTGVELDAAAARLAQASGNVDEVILGDALDPRQVELPAGHFDLIVLSHVLEHFEFPERLLARCATWLAPGGTMLVALPNVRHASVLAELVLRGDFRYRPAGILDQTHLRFYTRRSATRLLQAQGWQVERVAADIDGPKSRLLHRLSLGLAEEFAAFAYNFRLRRA